MILQNIFVLQYHIAEIQILQYFAMHIVPKPAYHDWNTPERNQSDQQRHHRDDPREHLLVVRFSSNPQHGFFRLLTSSSILNIFGIVGLWRCLFYVIYVLRR